MTHRQHAASGDVDILEQVERDEAVVAAGLGVVDDLAQLGQVRRAQIVRDVVHGFCSELADRLRLDLQEGLTVGLEGADTFGGDQAVRRVVGADRQQIGVLKIRIAHEPTLAPHDPPEAAWPIAGPQPIARLAVFAKV